MHILGRGKDLVISGGFNVYPKEIESEIDAMPGVIESAVIGVPHADFGEGVTAVVVCNKGADVTEAGVLKALDGRLAKFKMPKRVLVVDELPRNAMGKVQKNILRDNYQGYLREVVAVAGHVSRHCGRSSKPWRGSHVERSDFGYRFGVAGLTRGEQSTIFPAQQA